MYRCISSTAWFMPLFPCVGVLLISAPGAYVLSRWKFVGGKAIRIGLVIAMSVPTIMIIMPLYSLAVQWGIKGRVLLVVLYIMLRVPYTTIYLLDFFSSLSRSYEEAAYIDGCSHSRTFWQIMLPLVQPAIITVTIFNFMSVWNEFFMALIFTTSDSMTPVGVGLLQIVNAMKYSGQYGAMFAAVIIVFLPTFLLYLSCLKRLLSVLPVAALRAGFNFPPFKILRFKENPYMNDVRKMGRVTIPTDMDAVPETLDLLKRWGADAIRDCDGTEFPQELKGHRRKDLRHLLHYP